MVSGFALGLAVSTPPGHPSRSVYQIVPLIVVAFIAVADLEQPLPTALSSPPEAGSGRAFLTVPTGRAGLCNPVGVRRRTRKPQRRGAQRSQRALRDPGL